MTTVLMLVTAADHWTLADGTRQPAGFWAEEALGPYKVFKDAGYRIVVATPGGIEPIPVADAVAGDYDIIFVPGGWGPWRTWPSIRPPGTC